MLKGLLLFTSHNSLHSTRVMNITVDDAGNDPISLGNRTVYDPPACWKDRIVCRGCGHAEKTREIMGIAHNQTWKTATFNLDAPVLTAEFRFNGTAVYAYFMLFHRAQQPTAQGESKLLFYIDDSLQKSVELLPTESPFTDLWASVNHYLPATLLFSAQGLSESTHSIRIEWSHDGGDTLVTPVVIALDYIEYTPYLLSSSAPANQSQVPTKTIIGACVGGAAFLSLILIALFFWRSKMRKRNNIKARVDLSERDTVSPFTVWGREQYRVESSKSIGDMASSVSPPPYHAAHEPLVTYSPVQDGTSFQRSSNAHTSTQTSPALIKSPVSP
ncbi:hypothetical protein FA15DRAFT_709108 [Coprinopsis marcescibilis]|uniref:Uncharacterized protein n=1 Tax=Coprinopsis marcescibilis TaxID=230819 RepID=A0A5C3KGZ2_COPMA|nr:hypothetical protein FA15DRAFT_709108 [Coprinopsis marcescibilis]